MGKLSKDSGFKVPEGYFDNLKDRIMDKMEDAQAQLPENEGFQVPDGYFDKLSDEILSKSEEKETKVIQLKSYRKVFYAVASVAAAVLIFFGLQWQGNQELGFGDIASIELEEYFDSNVSGVSTYELAEVISIEELELGDFMDEELEEENIAEYLEDSIEDIDEFNLNYDQ